MIKRLWAALIFTFLIGIFALSVQPTAANSTVGPTSKSSFNFHQLIVVSILVAFIFSVYLISSLIKKRKAMKIEEKNA